MSEWTVPGYTELKPLGSGGFGNVVLARHDATGTAVAVKYLLPELRRDPDFAAMFRAEAQALGALDDPYVVRLYEYVESAAGAAIVMELIDGVTLWDILSRHGRTTAEAALVVLFGSLLGLAAAHARGVVHRDFKPRNVLVNGYGASKLTDFGIAARAGTPTVPSGSVAYAPPEQFDGGPATPASDVYAATATFYECLAGRPPFTGTTMESVIWQHHSADVPMEPVPAALQPVVARGMAKDPRYRPADAAALAAELRAAALGAYGPDWEQRGRRHLGEAAVLLAALWPSAGVPALHASSAELVRLSPGTRPAPGAQAAHHQASRAELHRWHLRHVRHLDHLEHVRAGRARAATRAAGPVRTAAVAVTAAAVVAAGLTVEATSRPPAGPGTAAQPAVAAYAAPLVTIPISAASGSAPVTGDTVVFYNTGSQADATISGTIKGAAGGQVVRLYARQFPYNGAPVLVGSSPLHPAGGTASYSFRVTPALATRYQAELFRSAAATAPIAQSAATTVYVALGGPGTQVTCPAGQRVCSVRVANTFYAPPALIGKEMSKHWYIYAAVNLQPGPSRPPAPTSLRLGGMNITIGDPRRTGSDSFALTVSFSFDTGGDASEFVWWPCAPDTEAQDGLGLPGSHGCGTASVVSTSSGYLG